MSADPWRVPDDWHVRVMHPAPQFVEQAPPVRWPADGVIAVLITAFVTVAGPVIGLIWSATAPKLSIREAVAGSEEPFQSQIAADGRFLLLGVLAGVVCAVVVLLLRIDGPAAVVGLAVGGVLAALVAGQVAVVAQHHGTVHALRALGIPASARAIDTVGLKVRASGVLMAWPIASVVIAGLFAAVRGQHR